VKVLEIRKSQRTQHDDAGVQVELSLSPYDLPEAVRGSFDDSLQKFIIEFKYVQGEEWTRRPAGDYAILRVGRNSNRLYGLEIDLAALGQSRVSVERVVDQALESLKTERPEKPG
jgi:hypothetical protein